MKKVLVLLMALAAIVSSCQKFDTPSSSTSVSIKTENISYWAGSGNISTFLVLILNEDTHYASLHYRTINNNHQLTAVICAAKFSYTSEFEISFEPALTMAGGLNGPVSKVRLNENKTQILIPQESTSDYVLNRSQVNPL